MAPQIRRRADSRNAAANAEWSAAAAGGRGVEMAVLPEDAIDPRAALRGLPPLIEASNAVKVFLAPERDELRRRIDTRFDAMLQAGALDEVRALSRRKLDPLLPGMKAHGVPWLIRHLAGETALSEAAEGAKNDTRRYTKRQFTWVRHQLPDWTWISPDRAPGTVRRMLDR